MPTLRLHLAQPQRETPGDAASGSRGADGGALRALGPHRTGHGLGEIQRKNMEIHRETGDTLMNYELCVIWICRVYMMFFFDISQWKMDLTLDMFFGMYCCPIFCGSCSKRTVKTKGTTNTHLWSNMIEIKQKTDNSDSMHKQLKSDPNSYPK